MGPLYTTLQLLSNIVYWSLTLYGWVILIAIAITWFSPNPYHPAVLFLERVTRPLWRWVARFVPAPFRLLSPYISLLLIWFLRIFLTGSIKELSGLVAGHSVLDFVQGVLGYFLLALGYVGNSLSFFLILILLVWSFLTFVSASPNNLLVRSLYMIVDPLITPLQRHLPRTRFDFSPLVAALIVFLLGFIVASAISEMGQSLLR